MGWFKKSSPKSKSPLDRETTNLPALVFKDGAAAIAFASDTLDCSILKGRSLPALVLDARVELGLREAVPISSMGDKTYAIRVPGADGGFVVLAICPIQSATIQPGDLVCWTPEHHLEGLTPKGQDSRIGWVGLIDAILFPEFDMERGWKLKQAFR